MNTEIKMNKTLFALFEKIAAERLHIETLKIRNMDAWDFHEVVVWGVEAALKAAYEAGYQAALKAAYEAGYQAAEKKAKCAEKAAKRA